MPDIISPERSARSGGAGLSYWLGSKLLGQPLAMRQSQAMRIKQAIDARQFDASIDLSVGISGSKFAGTLDARSRYRVTDDGIAIVPVQGMLLDRGAWLGDLYGIATSYEGLAEQMLRIGKDSAIKTVLLDIDSPGGQVAGLWDLTAEITKLGKSKKIVAIAANMADSAAYAIACAAEEVFVTRSGEAGSIGVIWMHTSYARMLDAAGMDTTIIYEGDHKPDGNPYQSLSHGARAEMSMQIGDANAKFIAHVAKERDLDPTEVREFQARTFCGEKAVASGLADGVKSFEEVLEYVRKGQGPRGKPTQRGGRTVSDEARPAAGRSDTENIIEAFVMGQRMSASAAPLTPAAVVVPAAAAAPAAAVPAAPAAPVAAADDTARVFAILECDEAKDRPSLARKLAKNAKMSVEEAKDILGAAAVEAPAPGAGLAKSFAERMAQPGSAAGVPPDGISGDAAKSLSVAEKMKARHAKKGN